MLDTDPARSLLVPEAFFNHDANLELNAPGYDTQVRSREVANRIGRAKEYLKDRLYDFIDRFDIDVLIPRNALAIPMHIPFGMAVGDFNS